MRGDLADVLGSPGGAGTMLTLTGQLALCKQEEKQRAHLEISVCFPGVGAEPSPSVFCGALWGVRGPYSSQPCGLPPAALWSHLPLGVICAPLGEPTLPSLSCFLHVRTSFPVFLPPECELCQEGRDSA